MLDFMKRFEGETYALLRIFAGLMFSLHGVGKVFGEGGAPFHITWIAGPIELVGGLMVAAGLFTVPAAFLCSGLMAFAYWMAHGMDHLLPTENGGEKAVLYCFLFLYVSAKGAGKWSFDAKRGGAKA